MRDRRRRVAAACCLALSVVWGAAVVAGDPMADWIFRRLQQEREQAGAPVLVREAALDRVAATRARTLGGLPRARRLRHAEPIEPEVREAGHPRLERALLHVDMVRGSSNPTAAFLRTWRNARQAWANAMDGRFRACGLATAVAQDGWVLFVAVLVEDLPPLPDPRELEARVHAAIDTIRTERGLPALAPNEDLAQVAREHSRDMARRGYFSHRSPGGRRPVDRVRGHGVRFRRVAENIHMGRTTEDPVRVAVDDWMRSKGHRTAILTPEFTATGVGVAVTRDGTVYMTQLFLTP